MRRGRRSGDSSALPLFADSGSSSRRFEARVLAGIDEAGLGPLLGPLTLGFAAVRAQGCAHDEPWTRLAPLVEREPSRDRGRLVVADSKIVFTRNERGRERLERTVLAFDALRHGTLPSGAQAFLARADPIARAASIEREPWTPALARRLAPMSSDEALAETAQALRASAARAGVTLEAAGARAIGVHELNESFERTRSKSRTLWDHFAPLLAHLWRAFGSEGLEVVVDRHGGRMRYAPLLRETFAAARVVVEREAPARSEYALFDESGRAMRLVFAEKAESLSFCVALASCYAKSARELCMEAFNAHFAALDPRLRPTAGYVSDGRRWLVDAAAALSSSGIAREGLVRSR